MNKNEYECLILAGGKGTRLQNVDSSRPKPLIPVLGSPFLDYQLKLLYKLGIRKILISTGYLSNQIEDYVRNLNFRNLQISTIKEDFSLGTGGAIKNAIDYLTRDFLVCNGDTISLFDLEDMISFHNQKKATMTMLVRQIEDSSRYGTVTLDSDNKIIKFSEKSDVGKAWISAGYFFLSKTGISWEKYPVSFSYEELLFPDLVKNGKSYAYKFNDYFIDIGIPESYIQFIEDMVTRKVDFSIS